MPDDLTIAGARLSEPRTDPEPEPERGELRQWIDIEVEVENRSRGKPLYVISSLRSLQYDAATRTLNLGFRELEPSGDFEPLRFSEPEHTEVRPGGKAKIKASIPLILKEIIPSPEKGFEITTSDLSELEHLTCVVAFDEAPFFAVPSKSPTEQMREFSKWGKAVELSMECKVPKQAGKTVSGKQPE